jgi:hypothetical protein
MHEAQWHGIASEVNALKARPEFSVKGEIKWRYFGPKNTDPENSVSHLDQAAKDEFRRRLYAIITRRKSLTIVACVADAVCAYGKGYVADADDLYKFTYKPVSERFQYHLQDLTRTVGDKQLGIIIADPRGKTQDDILRTEHQKLVDEESPFVSNYGNYVETIFLTPSHLSVGIQLADMVAGAVGRAVNFRDSTFARILKPSFRCDAEGRIEGYGFVRFPKNGWGKPSGGGTRPPDAIATSPTAQI